MDATTNVRPNQIWQGEGDEHSLIIIARTMVLPYLIGSYFNTPTPKFVGYFEI